MSIAIKAPGFGLDLDAARVRRLLLRSGIPVLAELLLAAAIDDIPGLVLVLDVAKVCPALHRTSARSTPGPSTEQPPVRGTDHDAAAAADRRSPMSTSAVMQVKIGAVNLDVPRSVGYYGGAAIAVGMGVIEPPLGVCIAAVPLLKLLTHRALPVAVRFVGELMEGASKPIGGDDEAVLHLDDEEKSDGEAVLIAMQADRGRRLRDTPRQDSNLRRTV